MLETFYYQLEGDAARVIIRGAAPAQVCIAQFLTLVRHDPTEEKSSPLEGPCAHPWR
jgi:hypothetical protein